MAKTKQIAKPYEPTPQERTAIAAYLTRTRETSPTPRMKVSEKGGVAQVSPDHEMEIYYYPHSRLSIFDSHPEFRLWLGADIAGG